MPYTDHERFMDIVLILILIGVYIAFYVYGQYMYEKGIQEGLKRKRKVHRENIYRLK